MGRKLVGLGGRGTVILKKWKEATAVEEEKVQKRPRGMWFERTWGR